jgi:RHS repeat-associated protein
MTVSSWVTSRGAVRWVSVFLLLALVASLLPPQPRAVAAPDRTASAAAAGQDISYAYDDLGRLVAVTDPASDTASYSYDAAGNILSIARRPSSQLSVLEFSPNSGPVGTRVTIIGTGFGLTAADNTVKFGSATATISSASATQLVVTVPSGASTGMISVTTAAGSASNGEPFTIKVSEAPSVSGFAPTIADVGSSVTISGANFESAVTNDRATFNGLLAEVASATTTSLTAVVPPGATSGKLSVRTPAGRAVSTGDFFTAPPPFASSDVAVTGRVAYGQSKTITLDTSEKIALLVFDGTKGQKVSLHLATNSVPRSHISLLGPDGVPVINRAYMSGSTNLIDSTLIPLSGTYTILIDPMEQDTGSMDLTLYLANDVTGSITPGGAAVSVTTTVPGQEVRLTFSGNQGHRVSLTTDNVTISSSFLSILSPDGTLVGGEQLVGSSDGFMEPRTLPVSGVYTVRLDPRYAATGSATLTLHDVPADAAGTISAGGAAVTRSVSTPGQNIRLSFSGTLNQRVSLALSDVTISFSAVSILKPDGTVLVNPQSVSSGNSFVDTRTLPVSGTYTIVLDPTNANTGSATFTLYNVPADATGTISPGGAAVTKSVTTPGQNIKLTFSGTLNQRVSLKLSSVSISSSDVAVLKPDGTSLVSPRYVGTSEAFIDTQTLPVAGTYSIVLNPRDTSTGSATFTLYNVPADATGTITIGGAAVTKSIGIPGQNARVTFSGSAGQSVKLTLSNVTIPGSTVSIRKPDGTALTAPKYIGTGGGSISVQLPAAGTYAIFVDPTNANTGSITLTLANATTATSRAAPSPQTGSQHERNGAELAAGTDASGRGRGAAAADREGSVAADNASQGERSHEEWVPAEYNLHGDWSTQRAGTAPQEVEPPRAKPGITALSGRVLTLDAKPLPHVTLAIKDEAVTTDSNGQFLLTHVAPGHRKLVIDGRSANRPGKTYGVFEVGVDIKPGRTNVLPYTIWMPKLDTAHTIRIASPTDKEVRVTTPYIPGLEILIPAGTTIRDREGKPVTEIGITPIPVDRPPFPMPENLNVPVYFTLQPGGAYISPNGAQVIYPNYTSQEPGSRVDFWQYDAEKVYDARKGGSYLYGKGTVSRDGKRIIPDKDVRFYEFTASSVTIGGGGPTPPDSGPTEGDSAADGDPVDLGTGLFMLEKTDLAVPDTLSIVVTRTYRQNDAVSRAFGVGASQPYDAYLWSASVHDYSQTDLVLPTGTRVHYTRTSPGTGYADAVLEHTTTPGIFYRSRIAWNAARRAWDLTFKDGTIWGLGNGAPLHFIQDRFGNRLTIHRASATPVYNSPTGNITHIRSPNGRWVAFSYDTADRITQVRDNIGRVVRYEYDAGGRLSRVIDPAGGVTEYTYDAQHRMLSIKDARGITYLTNEYDANGRVAKQTQADGTTYGFAYTLDANGKVARTDVTDPRGNVRRVTFSASGYPETDTEALGRPEERTVSYERQAGTNFVTAVVDPLGRRTTYSYDGAGNVTEVMSLAGTVQAVKASATYEPTFGQVTSVTDPLGHKSVFTYSAKGSLTAVTDPLGRKVSFAYDAAGRPVSATNAAGKTTRYAYDGGDLVSVTDPLGRVASRWLDGAGRPVTVTSPLGDTSRYTYDPLNQVTQARDPLNGVTKFSYDPNGNVLSVTDPRGGVTRYGHNGMDRVTTRTDPLLKAETYDYDADGNVRAYRDRAGKTAALDYDALGRPTKVTYADGSTTSYAYDRGDRLTRVADSLSGAISYEYDQLDRLLSETTPRGTVRYGYDAAGRPTSTTVAGQPQVAYGYDAADRLTSITQGTASTAVAYDDADRPTSVRLPNGVVMEYAYDTASQLTGIAYKTTAGTMGTLTYGYDAAGRVTRMGGSYARTGLPEPMSGATYDAANRLTKRGTAMFEYDANGNLTGDGTSTYAWDARGQLESIAGPRPARFAYDALGRRIARAAGGKTTEYLYDGENPVQELVDGAPVSNTLTGPGVDSYLSRTDAGGARALLTDALGSTIGLADASGKVTTEYTYDPFGGTAASGEASGNPHQYTGRENDGGGLYYYRARYYSPELGRFISEDPLGFGGGDANLYAYVRNSPTNLTDPSGENPFVALCAGGALFDGGAYLLSNHLAGRKSSLGGFAQSAATGCVSTMMMGPIAGKLLQPVTRWAGRTLLQRLSTTQANRLAANPALAKGYLSGPEYRRGMWDVGFAKMKYGKAVERMVARRTNGSPILKRLYTYKGGKSQPDFEGRFMFRGIDFDITTPGQVSAHLTRPGYGPGLEVVTYRRPSGFTVFP